MRTAALLLSLCVTAAADPAIVEKLLAARDPAERAKLVDELVASKADAREVAKRFAEGRAYKAEVPTGWLDLKVKGADGKERPYLLYVPENYKPGRRYPLLIDMHGGVSRPRLLDHNQLKEMGSLWGGSAKESGWFLAIPTGEAKAEWWTELGSGNVLSILDETRRTYDIDENRVLATGFSDGGSGSYFLALAAPTVLAGVVPLNGHIPVAEAGGLQVHLRNFVNVPVYAVNTANDQLYPSAREKPLLDAMKELGAPVTWRDVPGYGHELGYMQDEGPGIWTWIANARRDPQPKSVTWEGAAPGRVRWLRVTELGGTRGTEFPDVNPDLPPRGPRIGVEVDMAFEGPGARVQKAQKDSPAAAVGIEPGDVIVAMDGAEITDLRALVRAIGAKKAGDGFKITFRRGDQAIEKEGRFPEPRPAPELGRDRPWGSIRADAKENVVEVRAEGIRSFELFLGEPLFDLSKPVTVRVNGKVVHEGVVAPDLRFLAEQAALDQDRTMIYLARLRIAVGS